MQGSYGAFRSGLKVCGSSRLRPKSGWCLRAAVGGGLICLSLFCARTSLQSEHGALSYWHGWYQQGEKLGYTQTIVQTYPDRYRFERRGRLTVEMMGSPTTASTVTISHTDRDYALRDFDFSLSTAGHDFHVLGVVRGGRLTMTVESGGQRESREEALAGPVYPSEALPHMIMSRNLKPQIPYQLTVFDPSVQRADEALITVIGSEPLMIRDTLRPALKVNVRHFGVVHTLWIDSLCRVLKEETPPSSVAIWEPSAEAAATKTGRPPDLIKMYAVPTNAKLESPYTLKYLKMELSGLDDFRQFDIEDETQRIVNTSPLTITIAPPGLPTTLVPLPVKGDTTGSGPTLSVQSDNPLIVRKAKELVAGSNDAVQAARVIHSWVMENIRQKGTPSMPSAVDVLKTMEGDCNEHAILYAALCRAVGIPCKICAGLVYRDGLFWYHAWNKVYLGRWIPVDPTFGLFPIAATHLKLKEGEMEQQALLLNVVGKLSVRILEAR